MQGKNDFVARVNWIALLRASRVPFVTRGPNTARDTISVKCPFCGENDPSEHLGISLKGKGWGCLRNAAHRGKSPARLVQALLRCSPEEARRLVGGESAAAASGDELNASFAALSASLGRSKRAPRPLALPPEFKPLLNGSVMANPFLAYLKDRGYRDAQIRFLAQEYDLHYTTRGPFAYRLILPIRDRYGELLSWTARTIRPDAQPRYKTLTVNEDRPDMPVARLASNHTILGLPLLWKAENTKALVLVEGPFDALKVTAFGASLGVYATALFGLNVYPQQVAEIQALSARFEQVYLMLDDDAFFQRVRLLRSLAPIRAKVLRVPAGRDDPGALTPREVTEICLSI